MSTKNIAVNDKVYSRLARFKRESESFSKAIDRMLVRLQSTHTGRDVLSHLSELPTLDGGDAQTILNVVREGRETEKWRSHDLS